MQTSKIGLRSLTKRRLVRLAAIFAVLFSLSSIAQFCFVRWRILATTRDALDRLASQVSEEISYSNTWNLPGFRRSLIEAPSFCVFSADGVLIDMEGFASDLSFSVAAPAVVLSGSPVTFVSELGEKWHLFHKKVQGGWILLGLLDDPSINNPDQLLPANAEKFGSTLKEALRTEPREIDWNVDYAVVDESGLLRFAAGGVPLRIDQPYFDRFPRGGSVVNLKTQTYAIFSRSITNTQGGVVGRIIVPRKMTAELLVLHAQTLFNVSLAAFA